MKTIIFVSLALCATLAYASALPAPEDEQPVALGQPVAAAVGEEDDVLEGAEQRWGRRGWGGGGYGRGWGGGGGYGRGWGGGGYGRGWGGGGYGRGWGGGGYRGWGGGWGR